MLHRVQQALVDLLDAVGGYRRCQPLMVQVQVQVQEQVLARTRHC